MGGRLVLVALSTAIGFSIAEAAVRHLVPQVGWRPSSDEFLGWSSKEYRSFDPELAALVPDSRRVLVLGDSLLAGGGIRRLHQRFPIVMRDKLEEGTSVQVLATPGWGTDQELLAFLHKGIPWEPDIVVLAFTATNDLAEIVSRQRYLDGPFKSYFGLDHDGQLRFFAGSGAELDVLPPSAQATQPDHRAVRSYFLDYLRFELHRLRLARDRREGDDQDLGASDELLLQFARHHGSKYGTVRRLETVLDWSPQKGVNYYSAYIHEDFENNSYQWRLLEALLRYLHAEVEAIGAELIVMLMPIPFDPQDPRSITGNDLEVRITTPDGPFTFRAAEPRDRLREICSRQEIEFFDPIPEFVRIMEADDLAEAIWPRTFWPNPPDRHFSAVGHAILAEQLANYLTMRPI